MRSLAYSEALSMLCSLLPSSESRGLGLVAIIFSTSRKHLANVGNMNYLYPLKGDVL